MHKVMTKQEFQEFQSRPLQVFADVYINMKRHQLHYHAHKAAAAIKVFRNVIKSGSSLQDWLEYSQSRK